METKAKNQDTSQSTQAPPAPEQPTVEQLSNDLLAGILRELTAVKDLVSAMKDAATNLVTLDTAIRESEERLYEPKKKSNLKHK